VNLISLILETLKPQKDDALLLQITGRTNQLSYLLNNTSIPKKREKLIKEFMIRLCELYEDLEGNKYSKQKGDFYMSILDNFLEKYDDFHR